MGERAASNNIGIPAGLAHPLNCYRIFSIEHGIYNDSLSTSLFRNRRVVGWLFRGLILVLNRNQLNTQHQTVLIFDIQLSQLITETMFLT
jgi:hypothetical protein